MDDVEGWSSGLYSDNFCCVPFRIEVLMDMVDLNCCGLPHFTAQTTQAGWCGGISTNTGRGSFLYSSSDAVINLLNLE